MSTAQHPVTQGTWAEWRRRREANGAVAPPHNGEAPLLSHNGASHNETSHNGASRNGASHNGELAPDGFRVPGYAAGVSSRQTASNGFAEAQQAGLSAILGIAPVPKPRTAPTVPEPRAASRPPKPRPAATSSAPGRVAVIEPPAVAFRPAARPPEAANGADDSQDATASPERAVSMERGSIAQVRALPLTLILTVQGVLSLRLVTRNTAFTDEALYLWAGRLQWSQLLHHTPTPVFTTYFSGAPVLYPPVAALADSVGGLAGARILSLCFMLGATVLLHGVTRRIFDRQSAAFAAALFAALGSVQYLGALATYDAMALFLLAVSASLGIRAASCRTTSARVALILLAALALVIADAAKYAAALFDPVVLIAVACVHWRELGRRGGAVAALLVAAGTAAGLAVALAWGGKPYVTGIGFTTLTRQPGNWPIFGILIVSVGWVGTVAVLAVIGAIAASITQRSAPQRVLVWTLAAAGFLAPVEQARIHVFTSLFKHVGFGGWFAAAAAGYALTAFIRAVPDVKARGAFKVVTAGVALATALGSMLAVNQFGTWPSVDPVLPALTAALRAHPGSLLTDQTASINYYLEGIEPWQSVTTIPDPSIAQDVRQRRYEYMLLSFTVGGGGCGNADPSVKKTQSHCLHNIELRVLYDIISDGGYRLIARVPYLTTSFRSDYLLWAREGPRR